MMLGFWFYGRDMQYGACRPGIKSPVRHTVAHS
jgi:hypothetical protein